MNSFKERFETYRRAETKADRWAILPAIAVLAGVIAPLICWRHETALSLPWRFLGTIAGIIGALVACSLAYGIVHTCLHRYFYSKIIEKSKK